MIRRPPKSTLFPYPPLFRSLHFPGFSRPPYRLAQPSQGLARLAARGGDVEGGGLDAPLSHQGAGGDALHLPAVLRPLYAHGFSGEFRAASEEAHVPGGAERPAPADARLSA